MFATQTQPQVQVGRDLEEVQTEALGFLSVAGDVRLRLLPNPWPLNNLPTPTSSLMSIANRLGLVAAAGPDILVIAETDKIRAAFSASVPTDNNVKPFTPSLTIQVPRVSHVAFSSNESYLIIAADEGGGLAVYDVQSLKQGNTKSAFELATDGIKIRALVPNPAEETADFVSVILASGQLMLVNLKEQKFAHGPNGPILSQGVSCVAWSKRGKQLLAGLGNATALQMTPEGEIKAQIPRPPQLDGDQHVSAMSWLSNDLFLLIYTPSNFELDHAPDSNFMLVTRQKATSNYLFQKLPDPCPPFGMNRSPPHQFIRRLQDFPPNDLDVLLIASTAAGEIGMFTCCQVPLSSDPSAARFAHMYTTTGIANDARRAQLPANDEMIDTSPIGIVLDLSSREIVKRPMPAEELEASRTPLPGLMALNNDGVLSSWWFVYSESVRHGTAYPGLVAVAGQPRPASSHGQSSPFGMLGQPPSSLAVATSSPAGFGIIPSVPTFGQPSAPAPLSGTPFGGASAIGANRSPWGALPTSNTGSTPASAATFGSSSSMMSTAGSSGPGFGQVGGLGKTGSPWASQGTERSPNKPTNSFAGSGTSSTVLFGGPSNNKPSAPSGFAALAANNASAASPFASVGSGQQQSRSTFATIPTGLPVVQSFGSTITLGSSMNGSFGQPSNLGSTSSAWGTPALSKDNSGKDAFGISQVAEAEMIPADMDTDSAQPPKAALPETQQSLEKGQDPLHEGGSGFRLSPLKSDETAKDDHPQPDAKPLFGSEFGKVLTESEKSQPTVVKKAASPLKPALPSTTTAAEPQQGQAPLAGGFVVAPGTAEPFLPAATSTEQQSSPQRKDSRVGEEAVPPTAKPQQTTLEQKSPPLPPSPKIQKPHPDEVIAGSPPIDLGEEGNSPLSSAESVSFEDGRVVEVGEAPLPPPTVPPPAKWNLPLPDLKSPPLKSPNTTQSRLPVSIIHTPNTTSKQDLSRIPKSIIIPPTLFPRPQAPGESPRSPSPTRIPRPPTESQSCFFSPSPGRNQQKVLSTTPEGPPPIKAKPRPADRSVVPISRLTPVQEALSNTGSSVAGSVAEVDEYPTDDEDERIHEELNEPIEPTKRLSSFLAHQDYLGDSGRARSKTGEGGIPAQIEIVYQDINSMIDTLGLNARSLQSFVKGHSEMYPDGGRDREDLEREEDWCLIEIEDLKVVQKGMDERLEDGRPTEVRQKLEELVGVKKELSKLTARKRDIAKLARAYTNADASDDTRQTLLTTEQSTVLSDLRKDFTNFQALLAMAEDAVTLLRARLATLDPGSPITNRKVPTVEAISKTIGKMTSMAEQKSGDLDMLEAQMKSLDFKYAVSVDDLDFGALSLSRSLHTPSSRKGRSETPVSFATPPSSKKSGTFALRYSSSSSRDSSIEPLEASTRSSENGTGNTPRKSLLPHIAPEQVREYKIRRQRKERFLQLLAEKIGERA